MLELKYGKRRVVKYRGAKTVIGGLTPKDKIDILMYVSKELSTIDDRALLFNRVIELCSEIFEADNVTLRIWEDGLLKPAAFLRQTEPERRALASGEGFSGSIYENQQSRLIHDLSQYPEYLDPGEKTLCVICAPITVREDRLGTIAVEKNTSHFYKKDDLEILEAMAAQIAIATLSARLITGMRTAQKAQERLNTQLQFDLRIGRTVQSQIIHSTIPAFKAIDFRAAYEPMVEVSGDYFDYFRSHESLTIILADVSGHGVPAALITMALHYHFRLLSAQGLSLLELLAQLSEHMKPILPSGIYFTAQLVRIHADYSFTFVNAGHPKMLHYSAHRNELLDQYDTPGYPLGIASFDVREYSEISGKLRPGETLVMLTDGFAEQHNAAQEQAGAERVISWMSAALANPAAAIDAFLQSFKLHRGDRPNEDDLTVLTLHYNLRHLEAETQVHQSRQKLKAGDFPGARKAALGALELREQHQDALIIVGKLALLERDYATAARYLSRACSLDDHVEASILLLAGHAAHKAGDISSAKRFLKLLLADEPQNLKAALLLIRCYARTGELHKAARTLNAAMKYAPQNEKLQQVADFLSKRGAAQITLS
ncbi:MAG: SpoIIE family protein phosphatase [Leptospiraceae bacterium]|nr:SpoIIE family protein phosphatase [Leptospiraceae bacterium]